MARNFLSYNPKLVPLTRKLRNNSTLSEVILWKRLKNKQFFNYDFDRQKPIGNYIVDFFCRELMLAIEIDGSSHDYKGEYDIARQSELEQLGITVVRFRDIRVKEEIDIVLKELAWHIRQAEQ